MTKLHHVPSKAKKIVKPPNAIDRLLQSLIDVDIEVGTVIIALDSLNRQSNLRAGWTSGSIEIATDRAIVAIAHAQRINKEIGGRLCLSGHPKRPTLAAEIERSLESMKTMLYRSGGRAVVEVNHAWRDAVGALADAKRFLVTAASSAATASLALSPALKDPSVTPANGGMAGGQDEIPDFDVQLRELRYRGQVVKRFKRPAERQIAVIQAFQVAGWSKRIENPLPISARGDTLRRLNGSIKCKVMRFCGDGTGNAICWEPTNTSKDRAATE